MLSRNGFPPRSSDSGEAAGKSDSLTSCTIPTRSTGTLDDVFSIYPKMEPTFLDAMRDANFDNGIKGPDFRFRKERLLILLHLVKSYPRLNSQQIISLRDAVLNNKDIQKAKKLLRSFAKGKTIWRAVFWKGKEAVVTNEEAIWRDANNYASSLPDSRFLSYVKTFPNANYLHDAAVKCKDAAYTCLRTQLDCLVSGISQKMLSTQEEECNKQVIWEVNNAEEKELKVYRGGFVRKVEDLSRARSKS